MTTKNIPISQIENNTGQVEGLPGNPRITNPVKLDKLVESIKQDPEMLQLRGLLVYPFADGKYVTIGGNMRLQALKRLNYTECPCIVIPKETPAQGTQLRRICLHRTFRKVGNPILSRSHHRQEPPTHQPSFHPARQHQ